MSKHNLENDVTMRRVLERLADELESAGHHGPASDLRARAWTAQCERVLVCMLVGLTELGWTAEVARWHVRRITAKLIPPAAPPEK